jgi:TatA/E family protein of Tat protein translocase
MMGIGFPELMIILVIIMIIFGAGKLPEIGSAFGNSIRNFKKSMKEAEESSEELPEATDAAKEVTEGDSAEPATAENPVASTTEPEAK